MTQKSFELIAGVIFTIVAVVHLFRIAQGWDITIGSWVVPMWISWIALVVAGFLAFEGLRRRA